jgi:hypothetical protein
MHTQVGTHRSAMSTECCVLQVVPCIQGLFCADASLPLSVVSVMRWTPHFGVTHGSALLYSDFLAPSYSFHAAFAA